MTLRLSALLPGLVYAFNDCRRDIRVHLSCDAERYQATVHRSIVGLDDRTYTYASDIDAYPCARFLTAVEFDARHPLASSFTRLWRPHGGGPYRSVVVHGEPRDT